jgi:hypothetical protein
MNYLHRLAAVAISAAFFIAPSLAQQGGTVTNHGFAIGKGVGVQGFDSLLCGSGQLPIGQSSASPLCKSITGALSLSPTGVASLPGGGALVASRAAAAALDLTGITTVETLGYAKPGDGGGARFVPRSTVITGYSLTYVGSVCTDGTWTGVKLTGGSGDGASGTLYISGGIATRFDLTGANAQGNRYAVGDVLTASPNNIHCSIPPQVTVSSVGNAGFLDSTVSSTSIQTAGSGCTNGTYYGLSPQATVLANSSFGDKLQGNGVVSGGALTSFTVTRGGGGYKTSEKLGFVYPNASVQIPGCAVQPVIQIASTTTAVGSFTDSAGTHWQIDGSRGINVLQFGAISDYVWIQADADGTDNGPAMTAALGFAELGNGPADGHGYGGNTVFVPRGGYRICGGIVIPQYVTLKGASFGASTLKQCDTDGSTVNLITLGDPLSHIGTFYAQINDMTLYGAGAGTGAVIYSNNSQSGDAISRVSIYPSATSRGCIKYELGYGGQSMFGIHGVLCVPASPAIAFDLSGNYGFTIDGQTMISSVGTTVKGIRVGDGGFAEISGVHCEGTVTHCVSVNGTGSSPPIVHVIGGVGHSGVTNFVTNESGSTVANITVQNFVNNGATCALYNATTSTCLLSGSYPGLYPSSAGGTPGGSSGQIQYNNAGAFGGTATGTGVITALGVNVGSAGAFVTNGGALGTPSSGVATNLTGTAAGLTAGTASAVAVGGITGAGAGCITFLTTPSSANLRGCLTDESGTGLAYFQGGDIGTPSAGVGTNLTSLNASNLGSGTVAAARGGAGTITGALRGNGSGVVTQAACGDLSNAAASCNTDTTNATNIAAGTLAVARGGVPQGAWTTFSPSPACAAGSPVFGTATARWQQIAPKTTLVEYDITITTISTCDSSINTVSMNLPNTAQAASSGAAYDFTGTTTLTCWIPPSATTVSCRSLVATGAPKLASTSRFALSMTYENQ